MPPPVMVYTLSTCGHCRKAKKLLADCAVAFQYKDVDLMTGEERAAVLDEVRRLNPDCSFPTLVIGTTVIVGFREDDIRKALGLQPSGK